MSKIQSAIDDLASEDGLVRERAREFLVATKGDDVIRALFAEVVDPREQVRWEAAKALSDIADPVAAIPLVHAMHDEDAEVAWVASEGVARLGDAGLRAVLSGLTRASHSPEYCKAAHHSLQTFRKAGKNQAAIEKVLAALEGIEPKLTAPVVAYEVLTDMRVDEAT